MKGSLTSGGGGGGLQGGTRVAHIAPQPHPLIDYVTHKKKLPAEPGRHACAQLQVLRFLCCVLLLLQRA